MICVISTVGGINERIGIQGINQFASCKTVLSICFFLREDNFLQPVSLNKLSIDTCFGAPVTI